MKKILIALGAILILVVGALVAIPFIFKDEVVAEVKKAANESLTAKLDFKDVSLSMFRHFPKLSVGLEALQITGTGDFEDVRLLYCEQLDLTIDLWSAIFGDKIAINGLYLKKPDIRVYVLSDGRANYDIAKPAAESETPAATEESAGGAIQLQHYAITDGYLLYDDRSLDMRAEIAGLDHTGSGEFTADIYDLVMKTTIEALSLNYGGMQYLRKARVDWQTTLNADMGNMKFAVRDNTMKVNAMQLDLSGFVAMPNDDDIVMDLKFGTPENSFKSLLSLVPGAYTQDFDGVKANGSIQFAGMVKGTYNETTYPAFKIDFKVKDGDFKYPSLPLGVSRINVDASLNSPSQSLDAMTVKIPSFGLQIGSNPISGYFNLSKPESNPTVDTQIKGTLNLAELSKAFPMEGVQELSGIIKSDILAKASMNQIESQAFDQVTMEGDFVVNNMVYRASGMPSVRINEVSTALSPQYLDLRNMDLRLGKSDLKAYGRIDNLLAYFSTNKTMTGSLTFNSLLFDANEWLEEEETSVSSNGAPPPGKVPSDVPAESGDELLFDRWDFTLDGRIGKLAYDAYDITGMVMQGHFTPNKMSVNNFAMKIGESDLSGSGTVLNAWNYMFDNQTVSGVLNLRSSYFDLNPFMTTDEDVAEASQDGKPETETPAEGVMPVPENIDMTLNASFAKVIYTNLALENLEGQIIVKDGAARLQDCTANILGGLVGLTGEYNTKDLSKPAFNVDMALQNMSFKQSYESFLTVKQLAPIAQYIDGRFNTTLSMSGILGQDMMPDLTTLSAAGFLETIDAIVNNFKPMNEIGNKLNVDYLKTLELKNTRNWFEVKDGQVLVRPFDANVRDVAMKIGGSHGIGGDMDYQILTKVPRKSMGSTANAGLGLLSKEASKYGVNIAQGEYINVRFDLKGKLANPKVTMKVLGSDGESTIKDEASGAATAVAEKAKDSLRTLTEQQVQRGKDIANKAIDSISNVASKKVDEAKDKAVEQVKDQAGKVLDKELGDKVGDKVGEKAGEVIGDEGKKKVDDVKEKLNKWDPFKKKKGGER